MDRPTMDRPTMDRPTMDSFVATPMRRERKSNIFEQFTPDYISSPFDVDASPEESVEGFVPGKPRGPNVGTLENGASSPDTATKKVNKSQIRQNNKINLRLRTLLKDDTGEQEMEMYPDHSREAAEQLADLKSYSKLSEEARRKANLAVKTDNDEDETEGVVQKKRTGTVIVSRRENEDEATSSRRVTLAPTSLTKRSVAPRRRVRATVKETGVDSMKSYIKSLGQHELLFKEDEVLLGRQVRMLTTLEESRQELEEELLR
mmetsp:Transcript_43217/g.75825  ORF Transcript_43217/g.75825 Transcript_43217/m.75825 type:complete len:261 (-) Transcript_43217:15-797(-)